MEAKDIHKLFNGGFVWFEDCPKVDGRKLKKILRENGTQKEKIPEKIKEIKEKVNSLPKKTVANIDHNAKAEFFGRLAKLCNGKGSKYREDWSDITKSKMSFHGLSEEEMVLVNKAIAEKTTKPKKENNKILKKKFDAILLPCHYDLRFRHMAGKFGEVLKEKTHCFVVKFGGKVFDLPKVMVCDINKPEQYKSRMKFVFAELSRAKETVRMTAGDCNFEVKQKELVDEFWKEIREKFNPETGEFPNLQRLFEGSKKEFWETECEGD